MAHFLFNVSDGDRKQAGARLRAKMWGVGRTGGHRDALAPGDLALIYLSAPQAEFIGRAELATAVHDWTPAEAAAYPGDSVSGVLLADFEEWDRPVPMDAVVRRIDPTDRTRSCRRTPRSASERVSSGSPLTNTRARSLSAAIACCPSPRRRQGSYLREQFRTRCQAAF